MRIESFLDAIAREAIHRVTGEDADPILRPTQDPKHGDYQVNAAMALAKRLGKPPRELATPIADALRAHPAIAAADVAGPGFVNVRLAEPWIAEELSARLADTARDGVPTALSPERIVVDFSSPNIAKQMHVGHLRSTIIGAAIVKLLRFIGHDVIGDNHIGDWGTQFGLLIVGMQEWGSDAALEADPIVELERLYKLASERAKTDTDFADRARAELHKLQSGDPANTALWKRFVAATRISLDRCYGLLDVSFDEWLGESAYHHLLSGVVDLLLEKGLAREDQGAICVFWAEIENAPAHLKKQKDPFIIRKKDGAFLYSTSDIATIFYRRDHFRTQRAVYVVDVRQSLHFEQLFALAELLDVKMKLDHVGFGMMLGTDNKPLRTRDASGRTIPLEELLRESIKRSADHMHAEGLEVPEAELDQTAHALGIGAVKYADLRQNRTSDYQFDWDKLISFKGNAGPYMQYAFARIHSIFHKAGLSADAMRGPIHVEHPAEIALARQLLAFPDVLHHAAETYQPHLVTDHLFHLAKAFSSFYEACPMLKSEGAVRESRLGLAALTARQIKRGLNLLGIDVVDRM